MPSRPWTLTTGVHPPVPHKGSSHPLPYPASVPNVAPIANCILDISGTIESTELLNMSGEAPLPPAAPPPMPPWPGSD